MHLAERHLGDRDAEALDALLMILMGLELCERVLKERRTSQALRGVMSRVEGALHRGADAGTFDPGAHDAKLLLLTQTILCGHGLRAFGVEEFADRLSAALQYSDATTPRLSGERWLLMQLGYDVTAPALEVTWDDLEGGPLQLLLADRERLKDVCSRLSGATRYGCDSIVAARDLVRDARRILSVLVSQSARQYDLEMVPLLMRAMTYLEGSKSEVTALAIDFTISQQREDGRFGFLSVEAAKLSSLYGGDEAAADLRLYLPVTISCLWALAEALAPGFRLLRSPWSRSHRPTYPTTLAERPRVR